MHNSQPIELSDVQQEAKIYLFMTIEREAQLKLSVLFYLRYPKTVQCFLAVVTLFLK